MTRVRDDLTVVVDDSGKLMNRLDRNAGNKTSALETLGRLDIDGPGARTVPTTSQPRGAAAPSRQGDSAAPPIAVGRELIDLNDLPAMPAFTREDAARYANGDDLRGLTTGDDLTGVRWPLPGSEAVSLVRGTGSIHRCLGQASRRPIRRCPRAASLRCRCLRRIWVSNCEPDPDPAFTVANSHAGSLIGVIARADHVS